MSSLTLHPLPLSRLPIFWATTPGYALYYAPGRLVAVPANWKERFQAALMSDELPPAVPEADDLRRQAGRAVENYAALTNRVFQPTCLTVYLNNDCQLACIYCFSRSVRQRLPQVSIPAVRAAAAEVARNCHASAQSMTYVCHGGGEPTINRRLSADALAAAEEAAAAHDVGLFRYIATNGVMSIPMAHWISERFDLVGLSCDGPPEIQNRQRPFGHKSGGSAFFVERTASILRKTHRPFHVRVTLTPESLDFLPESVSYISEVLRPQEIHIEPAYGRDADDWDARQVPVGLFINTYRAAASLAEKRGTGVSMSLVRPGEVHAAYCHLFRNVLHLLPDDSLTLCFKACNRHESGERTITFSGLNGSTSGNCRGPDPHIQRMREKLGRLPELCLQCPAGYHCTHTCPDQCIADSDPDPQSFRCRLSRGFLESRLDLEAMRLMQSKEFIAGNIAGTDITEV